MTDEKVEEIKEEVVEEVKAEITHDERPPSAIAATTNKVTEIYPKKATTKKKKSK